MKVQGIRAQVGYRRKPRSPGGGAATVASNILDRDFSPAAPNVAWVTDICHTLVSYTSRHWLCRCSQFVRRGFEGNGDERTITPGSETPLVAISALSGTNSGIVLRSGHEAPSSLEIRAHA